MAKVAERTYLVRIRRMGVQWASVGVPVMPPPDRMHETGIWDLCPKLVPGQVIELPESHDLLRSPPCEIYEENGKKFEGDPLVEIVRRPARDEFIRPWVFPDSISAQLADPSKSGKSLEEIQNGLALITGAVANIPEQREKTRKKKGLIDEDGEVIERGDEDEDDGYVPNPNNRMQPDELEELNERGADLHERRGTQEDDEEAPRPQRGRRRR